MKKEELKTQLDSVLPRLYAFSKSLIIDELHAEQLVLDSLTVFLVAEKSFLSDMSFDAQDKNDRIEIKKYLLKNLLVQIYALALKRTPHILKSSTEHFEFKNFYSLSTQKRAILYLKEIAQYTVEDLQQLFNLKRHEIIELYHNSKYELLKDRKIFTTKEQSAHFLLKSQKSLIDHYTNGTLKKNDLDKVEKLIGSSDILTDYYQEKLEEKDFIIQIIPNNQITVELQRSLKSGISEVLEDIYPQEQLSTIGRVKSFLETPLFTIEY